MPQRQTDLFALTTGLLPAGRLWQRVVDARLDAYGISGACTGALLMIGRAGGGIRQVAVAQQLGIEGPSLVRLLDKLGSSGLVRRESDANDRRANLLWLTEAGQGLFGQLEQALQDLRAEVFAALSEADVQAVLRFYRTLGEATDRPQ